MLWFISAGAAGQAAESKVETQVASPVAADAKYVVSPRGAHLAAVVSKGSRLTVVIDGKPGAKVDEVITPVSAYVDPRPQQAMLATEARWLKAQPVTFSADGQHYAYLARIGQEWVLIRDGKEELRIPAGGAVGGTVGVAGNAGNTDVRMQFASEGGKHLFLAKTGPIGGNAYELWVDGHKQPGLFGTGTGSQGSVDPLISPDGEHYAYVAAMGTHPGDPTALIVDGKNAGAPVENLHFTPDSKHLIGIRPQKDGQELLVDGKRLIKARGILALYVAPAAHQIAAVLQHHDPKTNQIGQFVWLAGKPIEATLCESVKNVYFSPDAKHCAVICQRGGGTFWAVIDGKKGQEYQNIMADAVGGLFSPAGWSADSSKFGYTAMANGKQFVVVNDDESDAFNNAHFRFSPDSKHVVMAGQQGQSQVLIINGKSQRLPGQSGVNVDSMQWTADGARIGYLMNNQEVVIDGQPSGLVGHFTFSPDGKHALVWGSRSADNKAGIFIDGKLVATTDRTLPYCTFSTDGRHVYWMTIEPATGPGAVPNTHEWVTFADGKPVVRSNLDSPDTQSATQILFPRGFGQFQEPPPAWSLQDGGVLIALSPTADGVQRVKVTPAPDDGVAALLAAAKPADR